MKYLKYVLLTVFALGTTPAFATGDGYDNTQQFYEKFREDQKKYHGEKKQEEARTINDTTAQRNETKDEKERPQSNN